MEASAISSRIVGVLTLVMILAGSAPHAKVFMTRAEALRTAFPGEGKPRHETIYLTEQQVAAIEKIGGEKMSTKIIGYDVGSAATAYFDTHRVRTLAETIMVVVANDGTIRRIDILSFNEPEDYLPPPRWIRQLQGHRLDRNLSVRTGIRPMTGATLSGRAIVSASRRVLALHQVLGRPDPTRPQARP